MSIHKVNNNKKNFKFWIYDFRFILKSKFYNLKSQITKTLLYGQALINITV
jgi:hypothetical protein